MKIELKPVDDSNRKAVLALSVRKDQPFVAPNDASLEEAAEANAELPGVARPFGIYADGRLVGFCMFAFVPKAKIAEDRYWLWRFMIDKKEQGRGYGQAALKEIIRYFKENGADRLYLSTEPENERGLHIYHKAGFRETGAMDGDEAVLMRMLKGPRKLVRDFCGVDVNGILRIRGKKGPGVSIVLCDEDADLHLYSAGGGRAVEDVPVDSDTPFWTEFLSKPMITLTLLRYANKGLAISKTDLSNATPEFVEKVTGTSLEEAFRKEVAEPLKLKHTGFRAAEFWTTTMDLVRIGVSLNARESKALRGSAAGVIGKGRGLSLSWIFSGKNDVCVSVMTNRGTARAVEKVERIAREIYKNAKE